MTTKIKVLDKVQPEFAFPLICIINALGTDTLREAFVQHMDDFLSLVEENTAGDLISEVLVTND